MMAVALTSVKLSDFHWFPQINLIPSFQFQGGLHGDRCHTKGDGSVTNFNSVQAEVNI